MEEINRMEKGDSQTVSALSSCCSIRHMCSYTFTWCISGYSKFKGFMVGPVFYPRSHFCQNFCAALHFFENGIDVWIRCKDYKPIEVSLVTSIIDGYGNLCYKNNCNALFHKNMSNYLCASVRNLRMSGILPRHNAVGDNLHFAESTLTIQCSLYVHPKTLTLCFDNLLELSFDFEKLLERADSADVILSVGDEDVYVHSLVLCARSPIFEKMYADKKSPQPHSTEYLVIGETSDISVLKAMVVYMYTGRIGNHIISYNSLIELYLLAYGYNVIGLQNTCKKILEYLLTVNNVSCLLIAADECDDELLKITCMKFISENFRNVAKSPDWNLLMDKDPQLTSTVLEYVSINAAVHIST